MPQRVKPAEQGIVLDALSAGYGQTLSVDDINLTIPTGKMTVLAGANGSGKSTLLSTIARMLKPLGGCVRLDGQAIHQMPTKAVSRQLGILPQSPLTPEGLTVFTREHGRTVVTVLHDLNFAVNYADLLVFLKQGRIAGTISDNDVCSPELIKRVFDVDVQMSINPQTGKPFFMPFRARQAAAQ